MIVLKTIGALHFPPSSGFERLGGQSDQAIVTGCRGSMGQPVRYVLDGGCEVLCSLQHLKCHLDTFVLSFEKKKNQCLSFDLELVVKAATQGV